MYYFATKILQELLWPLNWALAAMAAALVLWRRGRPLPAVRVLGAGFAILLFFSFPFVGTRLRAFTERKYLPRPAAEYPAAGAIVVLGGDVIGRVPPRVDSEGTEGRTLGAARLFKAGKAPIVIVSTGVDYVDGAGKRRTDADNMREVLVDIGVPESAIVLEAESRTTRENAEKTAAICRARGIGKVLLVTAGYHLPRAVSWFRKQGLDVVPVPTGLAGTVHAWALDDVLPSADALAESTKALKEIVGALVI